MNNSKDLLKRLLKIYPVQVIKEYFQKKGKSVDVISDIVDTNKPKDILNFAALNLNYTKQHVYFYEINPKFNSKKFKVDKFPFDVLRISENGGYVNMTCLTVVDFDVIVLNPYEETNIKFYQLINITITPKYIIFQATTLEKDLSSYFSKGAQIRKVVNNIRNNGEVVNIDKVVEFLSTDFGYGSSPSELQKSVKALWNNDIIDSKYVKQQKPKSTSTEAMHEEYLVKEIYPDIYKEIMKNPILKTLFKYKKKDKLLPDHFNVDPEKGVVAVSSFSENVSQVANLINEIIKNN
jgi:hypothetical protein